MAESPHTTEAMAHHHEERDVQARPILLFGFGLLALLMVSLLFVGWLLDVLTPQIAVDSDIMVSPPEIHQTPGSPPQGVSGSEMQRMRSEAEGLLSNYGWVNRPAGVVRMPIERAMKLLIERGLSPWAESSAAQRGEGT